jgi:3-methyladenine DNA glycosylase/8-oxoguanine DNA glycosylase
MSGRVRRWHTNRPVDIARTVGPLRHGGADPTWRFIGGVFFRAALTPDGPATVSVQLEDDEVRAEAWGPGSEWMLASAPGLIGEHDDWADLDVSEHRLLHQTRRQFPGARLCRSGLVFDSLVPACLEQRVTGNEAFRAWRQLVRAYGQPAPGPAGPGLFVPPGSADILEIPSWDWHRFAVDPRRYKAIRAAATVAQRLEECVSLDLDAALARLRAVPGVGEWTVAETAVRALGHPDAVSVGDFHLKNIVGYALTGAPRSDDARMLTLLEPWRGQRARVIRLIELSRVKPPRFGPRFNYNDIRAI